MLYLEIIGIPGCGKTTICNEVYNFLVEKKISVANLKKVSYWSNSHIKKVLAIFDTIVNFKLWPIYNCTYKMTKLYILHPLKNKYFWTLILLINRIYRLKRCKKYDVIILDEGIAQLLTSIAHEKQIIDDDNIKNFYNSLAKYGLNPKLINCNLSLTESIKRIRLRGDNYAVRFSKIKDDNILLELLEQKNKNIQFVNKLFEKYIDLDTSKGITKNVELICNKIL